VGVATILELVWVLTSSMKLGRDPVARILSELLMRDTIVVEQPETIARAVQRYRKGNADFAGFLIAVSAQAAGCSRTVTFDRRAARDAGMELLE
jgi:predicted nucleic-acid-binding protein